MNSKVQNTFNTAVIASALVLGLRAASLPVADSAGAGPGPAPVAVVASLASTLQDTAAPATGKESYTSGKSRRIRHSMAMPFFSFLPRG